MSRSGKSVEMLALVGFAPSAFVSVAHRLASSNVQSSWSGAAVSQSPSLWPLHSPIMGLSEEDDELAFEDDNAIDADKDVEPAFSVRNEPGVLGAYTVHTLGTHTNRRILLQLMSALRLAVAPQRHSVFSILSALLRE